MLVLSVECRYCGCMITKSNMSRHVARHHSSESRMSKTSTPFSSAVSSRTSSLERGQTGNASVVSTPTPKVTADVSRVPPEASSVQRMFDIPSSTAEQDESLQSVSISPEYVRDATLCMIRKNEGYNIPAMSKYLENSFPLIPTGWRMPIVVAAFTAVQKASAVHGDTLLLGDDERIQWARRSLARWAHGLSAIEPKTNRSEETSPDHGPQNLLISREVPVPAESSYAKEDVKAAFKETDDALSDVEPDVLLNRIETIDIRAIMDGWGRIGDGESCDHVRSVIDQHITPPIEPCNRSTEAKDLKEAEDVSKKSDAEICKSMPITFDDLLIIESEDPIIHEQLMRPLSDPITPVLSPRVIREFSDEPAIDIHAPHSTFDEEPIASDVSLSSHRNSVTESHCSVQQVQAEASRDNKNRNDSSPKKHNAEKENVKTGRSGQPVESPSSRIPLRMKQAAEGRRKDCGREEQCKRRFRDSFDHPHSKRRMMMSPPRRNWRPDTRVYHTLPPPPPPPRFFSRWGWYPRH